MWEIYSIGDAAFLERILNAVAMMTGTGDFTQLVAVGFLLGATLIGFQSIMSGGQSFSLHLLLLCFLVWSAMFGTGVRVVIEDAYSGQIRVVDNVPIGVAATGGLLSRVGYGITRMFEQGYGSPEMTEKGFGHSVQALATARKTFLDRSSWGEANSPATGDDFWRSWQNYVKECTLAGVDIGEYTIDDIMRGKRPGSGSVVDQLRFDSSAFGTRLYLNGAPNGGFLACDQAHDVLASATTGRLSTALFAQLGRKLGLSEEGGAPESQTRMTVDNALFALEQSGIDAQQYMLATALQPIFEWGVVANEVDFHRVTYASMIHDGIQQRNSQWATEEALFQTMMRPALTFFEGFIYAITPMMGFLIAIGPQGISMVGKYLLVLVWVQLWMPVLSIVHLFQHMSVTREMGSLTAPGVGEAGLETFYGIQAADQILQTWIATGGLLASSVPAITLMLVYGTAVTATHMAGRLQGQDYIDEKRPTPDTFNTGSVLSQDAMAESNALSGVRGSGAQETDFTLSYGTGYQQQTQSAETQSRAAALNYGRELQQQTSDSTTVSDGAFQRYQNAIQERGGLTRAESVGASVVQSLKDQHSWVEQMSDETAATIGAAIGAGGKGALVPLSAEFTGQLANRYGVKNAEVMDFLNAVEDRFQTDESLQAEFYQGMAEDHAQGNSTEIMNALGIEDSETLRESASHAHQEEQRYQQLNAASQTMQSGREIGSRYVPNMLRSAGLEGAVGEWWRDHGATLGGQLENRREALRHMGLSSQDADLAAKASLIAEGGHTAAGYADGAEIMNRLFGNDVGGTFNNQAGRNEGVSGDAGQRGADAERAAGNLPGPGVTRDEVQQQADERRNMDPLNEGAKGAFEDAQSQVTNETERLEAETAANHGGQILEKVADGNEGRRSVAKTSYDTLDQVLRATRISDNPTLDAKQHFEENRARGLGSGRSEQTRDAAVEAAEMLREHAVENLGLTGAAADYYAYQNLPRGAYRATEEERAAARDSVLAEHGQVAGQGLIAGIDGSRWQSTNHQERALAGAGRALSLGGAAAEPNPDAAPVAPTGPGGGLPDNPNSDFGFNIVDRNFTVHNPAPDGYHWQRVEGQGAFDGGGNTAAAIARSQAMDDLKQNAADALGRSPSEFAMMEDGISAHSQTSGAPWNRQTSATSVGYVLAPNAVGDEGEDE